MKTIIKNSLILAFFILSMTSASAQEFHYGAKIGSNFSVQSRAGDLYDNDDIKIGLHAGVFGQISVTERFSMQAEVNYDRKGSATESVTNKYDYITVPVLARLSLGKSLNTPLKFNLYAGPYAAFLLNASRDIANGEINQNVDLKDNTHNTEWGVTGGFVVAYPLRNANVFLDFRLGLGLNEYDKTNDEPRNKSFGVSVGLEF